MRVTYGRYGRERETVAIKRQYAHYAFYGMTIQDKIKTRKKAQKIQAKAVNNKERMNKCTLSCFPSLLF